MADWQTATGGIPVEADGVVNSKRQRRPSVRLGEIGDQSAAFDRRKKQHQQQWSNQVGQQQWSHQVGFFPRYGGGGASSSDFVVPGKLSKTRTLVNIGSDGQVVLDESMVHFGYPDNKMQLNPMCVSKKVRHGRTRRKGLGVGVKQLSTRVGRVGSENINDHNNPNPGNPSNNPNNNDDDVDVDYTGHDKGSGDENGFGASYDADTPDGFKDSDLDTSGSPPMKETCTIHLDSPDSRPARLGSSECQDISGNEDTWIVTKKEPSGGFGNEINGIGVMDLPSDVEARSNKQDGDGGVNGAGMIRGGGLNGVGDVDEKLMSATRYFAMARDVRSWLGGLGLGRYAELFEMHEVDKEVLPLLTLDDLREMGINAVGARRKIYSAIQKIGKRYAS